MTLCPYNNIISNYTNNGRTTVDNGYFIRLLQMRQETRRQREVDSCSLRRFGCIQIKEFQTFTGREKPNLGCRITMFLATAPLQRRAMNAIVLDVVFFVLPGSCSIVLAVVLAAGCMGSVLG